jgi:hypothetical protein
LFVRWLVVLLFFVTLPIALGPATVRLLAGEEDHQCMCGMKRGTCGCPDCERLEQMRKHDREHAPQYPVVKGKCNADTEALTAFSPPAVLRAPLEVRQAAHVGQVPTLMSSSLQSVDHAPPPTPPPRICLA